MRQLEVIFQSYWQLLSATTSDGGRRYRACVCKYSCPLHVAIYIVLVSVLMSSLTRV